MKVRISQVKNHAQKFKCWLDAGTHYYYGRSYVDHTNLTPEMIKTESDIEVYLKQQEADFVKTHTVGCLPEWVIDFKSPKDIMYFSLKWVDNR